MSKRTVAQENRVWSRPNSPTYHRSEACASAYQTYNRSGDAIHPLAVAMHKRTAQRKGKSPCSKCAKGVLR